MEYIDTFLLEERRITPLERRTTTKRRGRERGCERRRRKSIWFCFVSFHSLFSLSLSLFFFFFIVAGTTAISLPSRTSILKEVYSLGSSMELKTFPWGELCLPRAWWLDFANTCWEREGEKEREWERECVRERERDGVRGTTKREREGERERERERDVPYCWATGLIDLMYSRGSLNSTSVG